MADKKERTTLMMDPDLKKEVDHLSIDRGDRYPCDTLEYLVRLGLQTLAEISRYEASGARSPRLVETGAKYEVKVSSNVASKVPDNSRVGEAFKDLAAIAKDGVQL